MIHRETRNLLLIFVGVVGVGAGVGAAITWLHSPDQPTTTPAPRAPVQPAWEMSADDYEQATAQRIRKALLTIERQWNRPHEISEPTCEPDGSCETQLSLDDEAPAWLVARYRKNDTKAVRFTFYGQSPVNCAAIGATLDFFVPERGLFARADLCHFSRPPLKGWKALIEENRSPSGHLTPGIHIYSAAYRTKDRSFRVALEDYERRARQ